MEFQTLTLDDLRAILRSAAGDLEITDGTDIDDRSFDSLGYDSLVLLETGSQIERHFGLPLDHVAITGDQTPRMVIAEVNALLADLGPMPARTAS